MEKGTAKMLATTNCIIYLITNTINKKDIITGIDRPIKFKEKHELVAKIIQFIKENVFKYQ